MAHDNNDKVSPISVSSADPTALTTDALKEAVRNLKENTTVRLDAIDKATALFQADLTRVPTSVDKAILNLREFLSGRMDKIDEVMNEKFLGIEKQFSERDKRTEQLSLADKTAIAAALQAQKEAAGAQNDSNALSVAKQEAAFTKLIDQTQQGQSIANNNMLSQINDLKSRLDRGEGHSKGMGDGWGLIVGGVGLLVGLVMVALSLIKFVTH